MAKSTKQRVCVLREKHTTQVSPIWKVLHVTIFVSIALLSFLSSWYIYCIFRAFNNNCVLYAEVKLVTFAHYYDVDPLHKKHDMIFMEDVTKPNITNAIPKNDSDTSESDEIMPSLSKNNTNGTQTSKNTTKKEVDLDQSLKKHQPELKITVDRSVCNFVLMIPLFSVIVGAVFGAIFTVCSRGGRGYKSDLMTHPQNLVYPIIILSLIFGLLTTVSGYIFYDGMMVFCKSFRSENITYVDEYNCTEQIDNLTLYYEIKDVKHPIPVFFYYDIVSGAAVAVLILWVAQLLVTLSRIVFSVDYQMYVLRKKVPEHDEEEQDTLTYSLSTYSNDTPKKKVTTEV